MEIDNVEVSKGNQRHEQWKKKEQEILCKIQELLFEMDEKTSNILKYRDETIFNEMDSAVELFNQITGETEIQLKECDESIRAYRKANNLLENFLSRSKKLKLSNISINPMAMKLQAEDSIDKVSNVVPETINPVSDAPTENNSKQIVPSKSIKNVDSISKSGLISSFFDKQAPSYNEKFTVGSKRPSS